MQVEVQAAVPAQMLADGDGEASAVVAARVARARERQRERQGGLNTDLTPAQIDVHCALDASTAQLAQRAALQLGWSGRSLHRVLKVARTIADLAGATRIAAPHLAEAMQLRRGLPEA